ncbi:hypothetical protein D9619_002828 [Psilocybe cf. subviscida]|uniref:PB1 domain-containing protein n=1 Tax=Psilocybe cf. subviscida TaxID=2480587 RepID=A0A8H5ETR3_9AGAR|nr:hypothetical protein D9619_002828 [Psilocybe cf. subviscida]
MPPIHFKLTKLNGLTRKVTFHQLPSWPELSAKLHILFDIPLDKVGVSYLDSDNDEITASSEEELQDYYQSSYTPGSAIKLSVVDITVNRDQPNIVLPERQTGFGVGADAFEFIDHTWPGISAVDMARVPSDGPHAFIEVLASDASGIGKDHPTDTDFESEDAQSTVHPFTFADKGKQRARSSSFGAASTISVLGAENPEKPPIHVADHNQRLAVPQSERGGNEEATGIAAQSTPKAPTRGLETPALEPTADDSLQATVNVDDPPLPSLDDPATPNNASTSLSHDVAALLQTFTQVIASHPELSEGVRNIMNNATQGTYWQSHRDALSQAVSGLSQSVDPQEIEAEAGRRVSNALGTIFRSLSSAVNTNPANVDGTAPDSGAQPVPDAQPSESAAAPQTGDNANRDSNPAANVPYRWPGNVVYGPPGWWSHHGRQPGLPHLHPHAFSPGVPLPPPPPPHAFVPQPFAHPAYPPYDPRLYVPPSGPPPQQAGAQQSGQVPPTAEGSAPASQPTDQQSGSTSYAPPLGPPPPPRGMGPTRATGAWFGRGRHIHHRFGTNGGFYPIPPPPPIQTSTPPPPPPPPVAAVPSMDAPSQADTSAPEAPRVHTYNPFFDPAKVDIKAGEQQLREGIEQAKRAYKAQKEAYRMLREERKKEKERENQVFEEPPAKIDIASLSLGETPRVGPSRLGGDNWSSDTDNLNTGLPRRNHTHLGHGSNARRTEKKPEDLAARAQGRVAKRLADMGFSESSFPDLPGKIKTAMPVNGIISKEREDDVVTTLLEELLARSGRSPVASGSQDLYTGGAW